MSDEITLKVSLNLTRNSIQLANWSPAAATINQGGSRYTETIQSVTTSAAPIQLGSIGTNGYMMLQNIYTGTYTSNYIYVLSTTAGVSFGRLDIGEIAVFKCGPDLTTPAVVADKNTNLQILVLEL